MKSSSRRPNNVIDTDVDITLFCVVSLSKNINPTTQEQRPYMTERLLLGCKESNETKQKRCFDIMNLLAETVHVISLYSNMLTIASSFTADGKCDLFR